MSSLLLVQLASCSPDCLQDSFLDEGFILDKKIGVGQPKRITDAKVLIANTPMDTDKIKIYGARVRVDSMAKVGSAACSPTTVRLVCSCRVCAQHC
jgi:T-complex protein 1 subunit beta